MHNCRETTVSITIQCMYSISKSPQSAKHFKEISFIYSQPLTFVGNKLWAKNGSSRPVSIKKIF